MAALENMTSADFGIPFSRRANLTDLPELWGYVSGSHSYIAGLIKTCHLLQIHLSFKK